MATLGLSPAEKEAVDAFRRDVVEPSMTSLVIIDFWAEWCGPCKALTPLLEKVTAEYAPKGVTLAKVDVDKNQFIASQFQVRSIPTVYAMFQGQLVADLSTARTESQLRTLLDQILKQLPLESEEADAEAQLEPLIAMGEQLIEDDPERALSVFEQIAEMAPEHPAVAAGRARGLVALGRAEEAAAVLAALPEDAAKDSQVERARAAVSLALEAQPVDDLAGLRMRAAGGDMDARYELAGALMTSDRDGAAETLLAMVKDDKEWNEGAARQRLLKLFEAVGLEDPWVSAQRRKLSAILFG